MSTLLELVKEKKISASAVYGAPEDPTFKDCDPWTVTLKYQRRRMTIPYYMGYGHKGAEPTAEEVLECLLSDASSYECSRDFEDFAAELGYDTDSRKAERIYKACGRSTQKLHQFLGEDYNLFMEAER